MRCLQGDSYDSLDAIAEARRVQKELEESGVYEIDAALKYSANAFDEISNSARLAHEALQQSGMLEQIARSQNAVAEVMERYNRHRDVYNDLMKQANVAKEFMREHEERQKAIRAIAAMDLPSVRVQEPRIDFEYSELEPEPLREPTIVRPELERTIGLAPKGFRTKD